MMGKHNKKPPEGFGQRLREALYASGLSTYDIEKRYGLNHSTVNAYMLETIAPTVPTLATLCVALNVSADWLLFGKK